MLTKDDAGGRRRQLKLLLEILWSERLKPADEKSVAGSVARRRHERSVRKENLKRLRNVLETGTEPRLGGDVHVAHRLHLARLTVGHLATSFVKYKNRSYRVVFIKE